MEGGTQGIEPPPSAQQKDNWISEWLDELCPYYMFLGVSCDDFWHGDYTQFKYYVRAHDLNRQRRSEEMWMQGLYNYRAVSTAIYNNFREKGKRPQKYLEEPHRVIPYTEAEKAAIAERERQKTIEYLNRLAEKWNNNTKPE